MTRSVILRPATEAMAGRRISYDIRSFASLRMTFPHFVMAVFILYATFASAATLEESFWSVKKSAHFAVYYRDLSSADYVDDVLKHAEQYYESITEELGFRRFDFWTWENQCKIYLYATPKEYYNATGQPGWSGAAAYLKERTIKTFVLRDEFLDTILPHEMTHLIFREFVGYSTELPLWLDEGVASLEEAKNRRNHLLIATVLAKSRVFIPLQKLTGITKEGLVMPGIFYAEAAGFIEFLLDKYGREKFVDYCRKLRDNNSWQSALKDTYEFKDLSEANTKWIEYLSEKKITDVR